MYSIVPCLHCICLTKTHIKNSSISLVITEMRTNTTRGHFSPVTLVQLVHRLFPGIDRVEGSKHSRTAGGSASPWGFLKDDVSTCCMNLKFCVCTDLGYFFPGEKTENLITRDLTDQETWYLTMHAWLSEASGLVRSETP